VTGRSHNVGLTTTRFAPEKNGNPSSACQISSRAIWNNAIQVLHSKVTWLQTSRRLDCKRAARIRPFITNGGGTYTGVTYIAPSWATQGHSGQPITSCYTWSLSNTGTMGNHVQQQRHAHTGLGLLNPCNVVSLVPKPKDPSRQSVISVTLHKPR
jgi:hypothetical protein